MGYDLPTWYTVAGIFYGLGFWPIYFKVHDNEQSLSIRGLEDPESNFSATNLLLGGWMIGWGLFLYIGFQVRIPPVGPY